MSAAPRSHDVRPVVPGRLATVDAIWLSWSPWGVKLVSDAQFLYNPDGKGSSLLDA